MNITLHTTTQNRIICVKMSTILIKKKEMAKKSKRSIHRPKRILCFVVVVCVQFLHGGQFFKWENIF